MGETLCRMNFYPNREFDPHPNLSYFRVIATHLAFPVHRKLGRRTLLLQSNKQEGYAALINDDALFHFRVRLFSLAGEVGVRAACRAMGVHHSTYYRWKRQVERSVVSLRRRPLTCVGLRFLRSGRNDVIQLFRTHQVADSTK
ncbi:MAG: transposase [Chloroflexi bacterium]|nr:transposase [Chloroflexota bacterium]